VEDELELLEDDEEELLELLDEELELLLEELELLDDELELLLEELELLDELELLLEELELEPPSHTGPVTSGTGAAPSGWPLLPCTPNSTDWPGPMVLFQLSGVAVYGLLPLISAFQLLVRSLPSAYSQDTSQPSMVDEPSLVIRTAAVKPVFHSLTIICSQVAATAAWTEPHINTKRKNTFFLARFFMTNSYAVCIFDRHRAGR
jgi:hypothetical protein